MVDSIFILLPAIALAGTLHILADSRKAYPVIYIFKPLTLLLILTLAASRPHSGTAYSWAVLAGLVFSLAGDIFLMLRKRRFAAGLACFLIAHLFYIVGFAVPIQLLALGILPLLAAYGVLVIRLLRPGLGGLASAVVVYVAVLLTMLFLALNRWLAFSSCQAGLTSAGAFLFVISDSLLAYRQFRRGFPWSQPLILASYYAAQTLIALG